MVTLDSAWHVTGLFFLSMRNHTHRPRLMCVGFSRFCISVTKMTWKMENIFSKQSMLVIRLAFEYSVHLYPVSGVVRCLDVII